MWGRKAERIQKLERLVTYLEGRQKRDEAKIKAGRRSVAALEEEVRRLDDYILELENRKAGKDVTFLFATIKDYKRVVEHLCAPDPVAARPEVKEIFNRYRIEL